MQKIVPFLWFNNNLEEAINFYTSIFDNAKVINISRMGEGGPAPKGTVFSAVFQLEGQEFYGLNGGPLFTFNEAVSFFVKCDTQEEIDDKWAKLTADGGQESRCGWLKDKFGLSWQIVPPILGEYLQDKDPKKAAKVMQAMMQMGKIDIQGLKEAYNS
ncbi:MAG: VOC family protein [Chitinophagaceae bacterium]